MFTKTLHTETKSLLEKIGKLKIHDNFYLAGGTALSLQLGHRTSVDLDFFSKSEIDIESLKEVLSNNNLKYHITNESLGTLDLVIDNVKISFLEYKYPLINDLISYNNIYLCSTLDIACMKITAISSRGSKKDFYDIWAILKEYSITDIFDALRKKYTDVEYSTAHLLKSLTYFKDAESEPEPVMIVDTNWEEVKRDITKKVIRESKLII